jgi:hypothetical protein
MRSEAILFSLLFTADAYSSRWGFMVIFWNFAGVPFVSFQPGFSLFCSDSLAQTYVYAVVYMASHDPSQYRFSTPVYVIMFSLLLSAYYVYVHFHYLRGVQANSYIAGTRLCRKNPGSRCSARASTPSATPSPSCRGVLSKTRNSSRLSTGEAILGISVVLN